jgi:hypothetical protein
MQRATEVTARTIAPRVPPRIARGVRAPVKRAIRAVGLQPRTTPLEVHRVFPGIAEGLGDKIRGETFSALIGRGEGRTMLDLGAGPCVFARRASQAGWKVTAVDARTERLPEELGDITFIESDVRDFDPSGFDSIAILGLLYHLTVEDQVSLLSRCAYTRVILETEVHTPGYVPPASEPWSRVRVRRDGYSGVIFTEGDNPMASIGNAESFWATEASLLTMFDRCGYRSVRLVEPMHVSKYGTRRFYVLNDT